MNNFRQQDYSRVRFRYLEIRRISDHELRRVICAGRFEKWGRAKSRSICGDEVVEFDFKVEADVSLVQPMTGISKP